MQTKQKGIISLIVILSVGFLALAAALTVALSSFSGLLDNRNTKFGDFAFYTSEAAAKEGFLQFMENTDYLGDSLAPLNNSSREILVSPSLKYIGDWYKDIKGSSDNNFSNRNNVLTITTFAEGLAFNYAVFSETALDFKGSVIVNGDIFANDGFSFNGGPIINGDAFSPQDIEDTGNINGDIHENVEEIPSPLIKIEDFEELAGENVFDNSSDAQSYIDNNTVGGVVYIKDQNASIKGDFTGCLVVEGDLNITGGTFVKTDNYPVIIVDGDLKITGNARIYGVVYVRGETSFGGGDIEIEGSLLSVGDISKTELAGNVKITFNEEYASIWQGMPGLDTTSGTKRIIDWRQE